MLSYLLGIFFPIIAPLIIFVVKRPQRFVAFHSAQSALIGGAVVLLGFAVTLISTILAAFGPLAVLAAPLWIAVAIAPPVALGVKIIAAIKSNGGEWYRVPLVAQYAERIA